MVQADDGISPVVGRQYSRVGVNRYASVSELVARRDFTDPKAPSEVARRCAELLIENGL